MEDLPKNELSIEGALAAIEARSHSLSKSEKRVADYVLREPKKTLYFNVAELARQSESSQAAVVRFCKHIGLGSFANFKLRLAHDVFKESEERFLPDLELESDTSAESVIKNVVGMTERGLSHLPVVLDPASVETASERILAASATSLFGVGASGVAAYDFFQKLIRIGLPAFFAFDTDLQVTQAVSLQASDVAFVVSYSGENVSMIEVARQARSRGATLVTLTMDGPSTIRSLSDISLLVPASERIYRQGAVTSRINQLTVIDILYSIIISRRLDPAISAIERSMQATHHRKGPS